MRLFYISLHGPGSMTVINVHLRAQLKRCHRICTQSVSIDLHSCLDLSNQRGPGKESKPLYELRFVTVASRGQDNCASRMTPGSKKPIQSVVLALGFLGLASYLCYNQSRD